jgi:two-component system phosphate regulon sensor histidine kinase PhoR
MGVRGAFFWLAAGLGLAGAVALAFPYYAPWTLFLAALCLIAAFLAGSRAHNVDDTVTAAKADPVLGLPALARDVFERLPDPLMLVDGAGRVMFSNRAMTAVVGTDTQNKRVSAVLRTPQVWLAV